MERLILRGLDVDEFIHPDERKNKARALNNATLNKALTSAAEFCHMAIEAFTHGTFVKMNQSCAPDLIKIIGEVCTILEVAPVPDVYLCHLMCTNIMPLGTDDKAYLVVPDYVLNTFDNEMLYYNVGNAITMIKAGHVGLTTLAAYLPGGRLIDIPKLLFTAYLHTADSTSDRGGLLASQSWAATARCHLFELGLSPKMTKKLFNTDAEAERFVENYLDEHEQMIGKYNFTFVRGARWYQRMAYIEAPANTMLRELFNWYRDPEGYRSVMCTHGHEYIRGGAGRGV